MIKIRHLDPDNIAAIRRTFAGEIDAGLVVLGEDRATFHMTGAEAATLVRQKRDAVYLAGNDNGTWYALRSVWLKVQGALIREETCADPEVDALNSEASFEPWIPAAEYDGVMDAPPALTIAGVRIDARVRREESGRLTLVVHCDLDQADPDITLGGDVVPVEVNVQGRAVWRSVPTDMVKGE